LFWTVHTIGGIGGKDVDEVCGAVMWVMQQSRSTYVVWLYSVDDEKELDTMGGCLDLLWF
jgi:hypothetical protein